MATGTPRYNPPTTAGATSGGTFTGGTPGRFIVTATGPTIVDEASFTYDWSTSFRDEILFSRTAVTKPLEFKLRNLAGGGSIVGIENNGVDGDIGVYIHRNNGEGYCAQIDVSAAGRPLCVSANDGVGTLAAPGTNDMLRFFVGTKSMEIASAWGVGSAAISNTAHTIAATTPMLLMSGFTANRAITLPAASGQRVGRILIIKFTDNPGANNAQITPAGADTLEGAGSGSPMNLTGNFGCMILVLSTASDWQRIPTVP